MEKYCIPGQATDDNIIRHMYVDARLLRPLTHIVILYVFHSSGKKELPSFLPLKHIKYMVDLLTYSMVQSPS